MTDIMTNWPSVQQIDAWRTRIRQDAETNYLYCMGVALANDESVAQAEAMLRKALELDPAFAGARQALLELLGKTGRPEEAAAMESQGRELDVDFEYRATLDRIERLRPELNGDVAPLLPPLRTAATQATPDVRAQARVLLYELLDLSAKRAAMQENDEACAEALAEMVTLADDPERRTDSLERLAVCHWKAEALGEATAIIRQAWLLAQGGRQEALVGLRAINILRSALHLTEAQAVCSVLSAHDPANTQYPLQQGLLLIATADHAKAVAILTEATKRHPDLANSWMFLAVAQAAAGNFLAAVASGKKAVECQAADLPLRILALTLALAGDNSAAARMISQARALGESETTWGTMITAITQWLAGDASARRTAAEATRIFYPKGLGRHIWFFVRLHPYAADFLGDVYGELGLKQPPLT